MDGELERETYREADVSRSPLQGWHFAANG